VRLFVLVLALLAIFGVLSLLGLSVGEADARAAIEGPAGALLSVLLLVSDVLIPVPATVVMAAQGAVFGPVTGAALAWAGLALAAVVAYAAGDRLGRSGRSGRRAPAGAAPASARRLLAIAATRPIPIVAEAVMADAGAAGVPARRALAAAIVGALPVAIVFAGLGDTLL